MKHPRLGLPQTITRRRELRVDATRAEQVLWRRLRSKQFIGLKFRRQYGIGPYIVDFCSRKRALVIEVDGDIHALPEQAEMDRQRQLEIESLGFQVVRYTNGEILNNLEGVLENLMEIL